MTLRPSQSPVLLLFFFTLPSGWQHGECERSIRRRCRRLLATALIQQLCNPKGWNGDTTLLEDPNTFNHSDVLRWGVPYQPTRGHLSRQNRRAHKERTHRSTLLAKGSRQTTARCRIIERKAPSHAKLYKRILCSLPRTGT